MNLSKEVSIEQSAMTAANIIAILLMSTLYSCTARITNFDTRAIIGGNSSDRHMFFVTVFSSEWWNFFPTNWGSPCGGTIIGVNVVVTAAHCIKKDGFKASDILVGVADFTVRGWQDSQKLFEVRKHVLHDGYNESDVFSVDIALLFTEKKFDLGFSETLGICQEDDENSKYTTWAIGVGRIQFEPKRWSVVLQEVRLDEDAECESWSNLKGSAAHVCYWRYPLNMGPCSGDSGGPLVRKINRRVLCLLGITRSVYSKCDNSKAAAIFMKASYFADWITNTIQDQS